MRKRILYKLIFVLLAILTASNLYAQFEEGKEDISVGKIIGTAILSNPTDIRTYTPAPDEQNRAIKNIISFKINEENSAYLLSNFNATVNFTLETTSNPTPVSKSLVVTYTKASGLKYDSRNYIVLPTQEQMVKITITGLTVTGATGWNPVPVLQLENEMRVLRYFNLATSAGMLTPTFGIPVYNTDALHVSWNWNGSGGTHNNMSQLEWAWVEDEMASYYPTIDNLFSNNSTRVDLDFNKDTFNIPLLYSGSGKLYYRVRAALRKNSGSLVYGPWSMPTPQYFSFAGHEPDLNWQSSTSFAENGKLKSVIQYFDGSLRSRQTVTKDNASGNTVVAETIYDLQGRPNIQILPTPTLDAVHPNTIQYFRDFNRFVDMQQDEDPAKYFDLTPAVLQCKGALPLNITKGNGQYYSANNPWLSIDPSAKFIADATGTNTEGKTGGFAYTETRFLDDATERVQSQGGVGLSHQIGSGHETKYYYGKPAQQEMDALFATEVGDASHYSKNMVRDANGQMSISYVDMHGRTIATALAGDPTPGIDPIINASDYPQANGLLTNQLLTPLSNNINGNSIESVSTILAPYSTAYNFTYQLDPSVLSKFSCTNQQICFDCKYDLEISIRSEDCGGVPIVRKYQNLGIVPANQACNTSMGFTGPGVNNQKQIDFTETLTAGSWIVRKTLTINDSLFQIRRDSALKVFLCKTEQAIYDSVYSVLYSTTGCGLPPGNTAVCDSCREHLGANFEAYRVAYLVSIGSVGADHSHDAEIQAQYSSDSASCANACGALNIELTTLKSIRRQMLSDMMPFTGQYALPLDSIRGPNSPASPQTDYTRTEAKYNIFTDHYLTGTSSNSKPLFYRLPVSETGSTSYYYTEDNLVDSTVHGHNVNNGILLDTMQAPAYTDLFQSSWARSLIYRHPEFSKLKYAENNLSSTYEWLDKVQGTDNYWGTDGAQNKHYDDPLGTVNPDPFFTIPANATDKAIMDRRIKQGVIINGSSTSGPSIWQMANSVVLCATADSAQKEICTGQMIADKMDPAITVDSLKDKVWEHFRSLYLSYRNELVLKYIDAHAVNPLPQVEKDSLISQGKSMNFATQADVAAQNGHGTLWGHFNENPPDTTGITEAGNGAGINTDKCEGQRPLWRAKLKQCEQLKSLLNNESASDSTTVNNIINSILDGMVSVCRNSLNAQQPYGASNVNPAYSGTPQNFEEVINQVFAANGIHTLPGNKYFCNPYTIDYPKPYGKNVPVFTNYSNTIDSCGCARFAALKLEAGADSATFASMNHFLLINYNDTLTLPLWTGLQQCNNAWKDTCQYTWGPADSSIVQAKGLKTRINAGKGDDSDCPTPVIISAIYTNNVLSINNIKVVYNTGTTGYNCLLTVSDNVGNYITSFPVNCGYDSVETNLEICNTYIFTITVDYGRPCGSITSAPYTLYPDPSCGENDCPTPVITSAAYINSGSVNNIKIKYSSSTSYSSCYITVKNSSGTVVLTQTVNCGTDSVTVSLPSCTPYTVTISGTSKLCGTITSSVTSINPLPGCSSCPKPVITQVRVLLPTPPNTTTQNVRVYYSIPTGGSNCVLKVYNNFGTEVYSQAISCTGNLAVLYGMAACQQYRFVIKSDFFSMGGGSCIQVPSDTVKLDSCYKVICTKLFVPIHLPSVVVIPQFLNCGYVKPCITCGKLDSLTNAFRLLYPAYSGVPYLDSTATDAQGSENALWARYLNYKTGFSKNALDYMMAYKNCHNGPPPTAVAICSFTRPLNDPGVFYTPDTMPCRTVQTQAAFIAHLLYQQRRDSLLANFDSLYKAKCFEAKNKEVFYVRYQPKEYHYTLYFYDQAGNLVKTLPPAAVKPNYDATYLANVVAARNAGNDILTSNNELLATHYRYNSLNQVVAQKTPDAGISKFWYDRLGRLAVSQNAKQILSNNYSYTLYDQLGRITEVGQSTNTTLMTQTISQDNTALTNWINNTSAGTKKQITLTFYDRPYTSVAVSGSNGLTGLYQQNLRNRVSYSMVFDDENQKVLNPSDSTIMGGNSATYYSYDIHGNVDTLLQDYKTGMGAVVCGGNGAGNRFKKMVYSYDLISGKVNDVAYQPGAPDQFYHRYSYDAENRLTLVQTSKDKIYWEQDASYSYYRHGPLARAVIGQNQVQGLDYAYNLQGWLKGVNSTSAGTGDHDMGQDGKASALNSLVARDAFGFSLNYFTGDYKPISTTVAPFVTVPMNLPADPGSGISTGSQLFNGNIGAMLVNIPKLGDLSGGVAAMVYGYRYDQLNRIKRMDAFTGFVNSSNSFTNPVRTNDYHEEVTYDPNGNIKSYNRNGSSASGTQTMDILSYSYNLGTGGVLANNRLRHVTDAAGANPAAGDIGTQGADNYSYDAIGNLTGDNAEGISAGNITWTVYGKIKSITKAGGTGQPGTTINYTYDAGGNRISKAVTVSGITKTTYYVRDASGNVMSIYQAGDNTVNSGNLSQTELHLYGNSRLGVYNLAVDVQCVTSSQSIVFTRGSKFFELSNHLGNVLATISDRKIQHSSDNTVVDYYLADVITANDYYPGGMNMPGRKYSTGTSYRYGFNGQEKSDEIFEGSTTAEYWEYDSRISRRWNMDPDVASDESPYAVNHNNPIAYSDPDGDFPIFGFLVGMITEFVIQTVEIKIGIRKDYDVKAMVISGVATQLGMGIGKQISRISTLGKVAKTILNVGKDVALNLGEQGAKTLYDPNAKVSITDAFINAGASKILGDLAETGVKKYTSKGSELVAKAEQKAARATKVQNGKRLAELKKAEEAVQGYVAPRAIVASVPATGAVTRTYDAVTKTPTSTDINTKTGTNAASVQPTATVTPSTTTTTKKYSAPIYEAMDLSDIEWKNFVADKITFAEYEKRRNDIYKKLKVPLPK